MNQILAAIGFAVFSYGVFALTRGEVKVYNRDWTLSAVYTREEEPKRFYLYSLGYALSGLALGGLMLFIIVRKS